MIRRSLLAVLSSITALAASTLAPAAAGQAASAPGQTAAPPLPEPGPIEVDAATSARARRLLDALSRGTVDRSELAPELDAFLPADVFANAATYVDPLGTPQSIFAFEKRITAEQTSTFFRVRYPKETLTWVMTVDGHDRISGLSLRRSPRNKILNVTYRDIQY